MDALHIEASGLSEVVQLASSAERQLTSSLEQAKKLVPSSSDYGQTWTGEAKDSYLMYLSIVSQYHGELAKSLKLYKKAVKNLQTDCSTFDSSEMSEIRSV
ncbi:hypothetical protein [Enterococcus rivorum]|uniref:Uncharacterized protein n=1 Tax=Enterococcus rivorum TaxID=762845 RepID=A0A1E5KUP0_9ENTE|nr:hypothetical protein [Enterococcus rivorum]MBP2100456.1 uncharacterized protein YukE [Enterococcus rivorum]OEH81617.1 hypothetical protein BCR26_16215 [Enterococcus rivorum]